MDPDHLGHDAPPDFWRSRYAVGLVVLGGIAAYFLLTEHLAHVMGALPYLFLLACPLMHAFMHHGHGHGHGRHGHHHCGPGAGTGAKEPQQPRDAP